MRVRWKREELLIVLVLALGIGTALKRHLKCMRRSDCSSW